MFWVSSKSLMFPKQRPDAKHGVTMVAETQSVHTVNVTDPGTWRT